MSGHEHSAAAASPPDDARVLEAALIRTAYTGCDRFELAAALDWPLDRLDHAVAQLDAALATRALAVVASQHDIHLALRDDILTPAALARLAAHQTTHTALSTQEAERLVDLIAERLTSPVPTEACTVDSQRDPAMLERGLLEKLSQSPEHYSYHGRVGAHPDVFFALGLSPGPASYRVPNRPLPPEMRQSASRSPDTNGHAEETGLGAGPDPPAPSPAANRAHDEPAGP